MPNVYRFTVTDYEESFFQDFGWTASYSPPTEEEFAEVVMSEAIKLYNEGNHTNYVRICEDVELFQIFLRTEFDQIFQRVNDNTLFKKCEPPKYWAMISGTDTEELQKQMESLGLEIPKVAGNFPYRKGREGYCHN